MKSFVEVNKGEVILKTEAAIDFLSSKFYITLDKVDMLKEYKLIRNSIKTNRVLQGRKELQEA